MHQHAKNAPDEDQKLLSEFVRSRSEQAFSALVEKYAPMVFNAAFRKTGDRPTAEEITQNVFTILARKAAKLKRGSVLAGWLYRTAMFECSHALRKASSHKRKMKALAEQQSIQMVQRPGRGRSARFYIYTSGAIRSLRLSISKNSHFLKSNMDATTLEGNISMRLLRSRTLAL